MSEALPIVVSGLGKMGQMITQLAPGFGCRVVATIDPVNPDADHLNLSANALSGCRICIDFTLPDAVLENIRVCASAGVSMVIGTTGWYDRIDEARAIAGEGGISVIWGSNFSPGMNLFFLLAEHAARLVDSLPDYDIAGFETHHRNKVDSPSGTARTLAGILLENIDRKKQVNWDRIDRKPEEDELHFASLRTGAVPGTHEILFDGPADTIRLIHSARNREALARGALQAARWLEHREGFLEYRTLFREMTEK